MTVEQDFLPFAAGGGANVISQASYASLPALAAGFSSGLAASNQLNKVWRQSSIMAAVLGDLIANVSGNNVIDDGTTATILASLLESLTIADYQADTGVANAYAVTFNPSIPLKTGMSVRFLAAHTNTGASTLAINGNSPKAIVGQDGNALTGGEIVVNGQVTVTYNGTSFVITSNTLGYAKSATPPIGDNSTKVATTGWVISAMSLTANGYVKFGNGLLIQWQTVSSGGGVTGSFNFPIAFPTACLATFGTAQTVGYLAIEPTSTTQAAYVYGGAGTTGGTFYALSIGH